MKREGCSYARKGGKARLTVGTAQTHVGSEPNRLTWEVMFWRLLALSARTGFPQIT